MLLQVRVTQEDIDSGAREDCKRCPIARALRRLGFGWVVVDGTCAFLAESIDADQESAELPDVAVHFIGDFDIGRPVQPFAFNLEFPQ